MNPNQLQKLFENTIKSVIKEKGITEEKFKDYANNLIDNIPDITDDIASLIYDSLLKRSNKMLLENRTIQRNFEKRHYNRWKSGIDLLHSYLVATYELGDSFNRFFRNEAAKTNDYLFDALTRLHARSIHVGYEVLCLLRSGFADGAHARWRTAHEIAVVANFLSKNKDTAKRYLDHEIVESYKAMIQFQKYAKRLGYKKYTKKEVDLLTNFYDNLCKEYGSPFRYEYGWAAESLGKDNPNFTDIEIASGLDHMRPYYKMASYNVHANTKGIKFRMGLLDREDILLAGPSSYGLTDPAHGTAISILQATSVLLNIKISIDSIVMNKILLKFVDDIGEAFIKVDRKMKRK